MLKGGRFSVEVKSFLKVIFCKTIATSSFIKPIEIDKVLKKRTFFEAQDLCPLFLFSTHLTTY